MQRYECGAGAATGIELATAVGQCSATLIPTAFLILDIRPGGTLPTIQCYHRITPFIPRMGMPASRWDNQSFAFSGELFGNQVSTVTWDNTVFDPVRPQPILVATDIAIAEALALDPNIRMTGPHVVGAAGTVGVQVRRTILSLHHSYL